MNPSTQQDELERYSKRINRRNLQLLVPSVCLLNGGAFLMLIGYTWSGMVSIDCGAALLVYWCARPFPRKGRHFP